MYGRVFVGTVFLVDLTGESIYFVQKETQSSLVDDFTFFFLFSSSSSFVSFVRLILMEEKNIQMPIIFTIVDRPTESNR